MTAYALNLIDLFFTLHALSRGAVEAARKDDNT